MQHQQHPQQYLLHWCIFALQARILASGDVEVDEGDYDERTPLHLAASEGHEEMVVLLLDIYRADMNITDRYGGTPMIDAVRHKRDNIAKLLRNHGAVLKVRDAGGGSARMGLI